MKQKSHSQSGVAFLLIELLLIGSGLTFGYLGVNLAFSIGVIAGKVRSTIGFAVSVAREHSWSVTPLPGAKRCSTHLL